MSSKKIKNKFRYSLFDNLFFMIKKAIHLDHQLVLLSLLQIPIVVLLPLCSTYLSRSVIMLITNDATLSQLIANISGFIVALLVFNLLKRMLETKIHWRSFRNRFAYLNLCSEKIMSMDYDHIENPDGQTKMQKAINGLYSLNGGIQNIFGQFVSICSNIIGLLAYSFLIIHVNVWIVVILLVLTVANYFINRTNQYWIHRNKDNWVPIDRKLTYINTKIGDFKCAKDIRLYGMSDWLFSLFHKFFKERKAWYIKEKNRGFVMNLISVLITFIRDGLAYGILIYEIVYHNMSAADFVFYFSLISQYANWLFGMIGSYNALQTTSLNIRDVREFLDLPDRFNRELGPSLPQNAGSIVFDHVSYCYPKSEKATLSDIHFEIKPGEKIAIVGLNGAGKSTLVKLLCGLYMPTSGSILVSGTSIAEYNIYEYYSILSVVFQDIYLMPVSVAKNITLCENDQIDKARLTDVIQKSNLYHKIQELPEKEDTLLLKSICENAVDLSGGELQKLALARALYKNGYILVLDEPTAALDPIAENEMYLKYNELTKDRTSIFISHRLSSTRFCDCILFLENGRIVESGSHDELMRLNGRYAELFEIQSRYYKEEGARNEESNV